MSTKSIRPWQVFDLLKGKGKERLASVYLPHRHSLISSLETMIIVSIVKYMKPKKCFEFGTFRGETSMSIAANLAPNAVLYTLDLNKTIVSDITFSDLDKRLAEIAISETPRFIGTSLEKNIKRIYSDSKKFEVKEPYTDMDLVFVDGNHELSYVKSDTEKAFQMLSPNGCIIWHDYGPVSILLEKNKGENIQQFIELKDYIDHLGEKIPIFYVEDTRLALYSTCFSSEFSI